MPDLIVLHYTAMPTATDAVVRLCDPAAEVSAHYLVDEAGRILALVPEELRAWHAGAGRWGAVTDVNSRSIGIELASTGKAPFAARQMAALERLLADLRHRWQIPPERVIGHSDMAPDRKNDPGPRFDWRALALAGHSVWPDGLQPYDDAPDQAAFAAAARAFGYADLGLVLMLSAFRLRFRPWATGPLDGTDIAIARNLAARFPVDAAAATA